MSNVKMVVGESGGGFAETQRDCRNAMMGFGERNAEVEGKVVDYTRCGSWKHGP